MIEERESIARSRDLLVTLLGRYVYGRDEAVYSGTFVDVLGQAGVKEHAARSALARMVPRGRLERRRVGRRTYFSLTESMTTALAEGHRRIYETDPVLRDWDGEWTLLCFSIPEALRADRHRLRVRLAWAGFGPLRDGLWVAPGRRRIEDVVPAAELRSYVIGFDGRLLGTMSAGEVVEQVWNLEEIAGRYEALVRRWTDPPMPEAPSDLARHLHLITDWRMLLRQAPRLPAEVLPRRWPAGEAWERFHELDRRWRHEATAVYEAVKDVVETSRNTVENIDGRITTA